MFLLRMLAIPVNSILSDVRERRFLSVLRPLVTQGRAKGGSGRNHNQLTFDTGFVIIGPIHHPIGGDLQ